VPLVAPGDGPAEIRALCAAHWGIPLDEMERDGRDIARRYAPLFEELADRYAAGS
jgi:hypothetical protein